MKAPKAGIVSLLVILAGAGGYALARYRGEKEFRWTTRKCYLELVEASPDAVLNAAQGDTEMIRLWRKYVGDMLEVDLARPSDRTGGDDRRWACAYAVVRKQETRRRVGDRTATPAELDDWIRFSCFICQCGATHQTEQALYSLERLSAESLARNGEALAAALRPLLLRSDYWRLDYGVQRFVAAQTTQPWARELAGTYLRRPFLARVYPPVGRFLSELMGQARQENNQGARDVLLAFAPVCREMAETQPPDIRWVYESWSGDLTREKLTPKPPAGRPQAAP